MKKKILGTVLAAALVLTQAVTVFAAGSRTADVAVSGGYEVAEGTAETFSYISDTAVVDAILAVNDGSASLDSIAELAPELESELSGKEAVTPFFELSADGAEKDADGNYVVTLSVPSLTSAMSDVKLLHYSTVRSTWEVITPDNVDVAAQEITAKFADLSPVAVIAKVDSSAATGTTSGSSSTATGTSPQTGVATGWIALLGAAVVLAGVSYTSYRKARR